MAELNKITGIVVGQYGNVITLTVVDANGNALDISSYTGMTVYARAPFDLKTLSWTASFVTDGSDGKIQFTPLVASIFDRSGSWTGQVKLTKTSIVAWTVPFTIEVQEALA